MGARKLSRLDFKKPKVRTPRDAADLGFAFLDSVKVELITLALNEWEKLKRKGHLQNPSALVDGKKKPVSHVKAWGTIRLLDTPKDVRKEILQDAYKIAMKIDPVLTGNYQQEFGFSLDGRRPVKPSAMTDEQVEAAKSIALVNTSPYARKIDASVKERIAQVKISKKGNVYTTKAKKKYFSDKAPNGVLRVVANRIKRNKAKYSHLFYSEFSMVPLPLPDPRKKHRGNLRTKGRFPGVRFSFNE
jgi:hypothetical protein